MYLKSHKDLIIWQKSIKLVKEVFLLTDKFPKSELYGITSQMRRAAVSIPSNIAEGHGRKSHKERSHAFSISYGSSLELETQSIIAKELNFSSKEEFTKVDNLLDEVLRMLNVMTTKMRSLDANV